MVRNATMVVMTMIITITRIRKMETIKRLKIDIFCSSATHLSFRGKRDFQFLLINDYPEYKKPAI